MGRACSDLSPLGLLVLTLSRASPPSQATPVSLSPLAQLTGSSRRGQEPLGLQSQASVHTGACLLGSGWNFLFMRITSTPWGDALDSPPGSPSSLDLSPSQRGPHISLQAPSSLLRPRPQPSPYGGEGKKGGGVRSLRKGQECGSRMSNVRRKHPWLQGPAPPSLGALPCFDGGRG